MVDTVFTSTPFCSAIVAKVCPYGIIRTYRTRNKPHKTGYNCVYKYIRKKPFLYFSEYLECLSAISYNRLKGKNKGKLFVLDASGKSIPGAFHFVRPNAKERDGVKGSERE